MKINIYELEVSHVASSDIEKRTENFLSEIEKKCNIEFIKTDDIESCSNNRVIIFVKTGGTETDFLKIYPCLNDSIVILSTPDDNSLAASMEIASYVRRNKQKAVILHGETDYIAEKLGQIIRVDMLLEKFKNMKLGVIGEPSDWLIASGFSKEYLNEKFRIEIINITIEELENEIQKTQYEKNILTEKLFEKNFSRAEKEKALWVYGGLKRIVKRYNLTGLTVRCFDLVLKHKITGCTALSLLNSEKIYASCEGDVPALLSMVTAGELTGEYSFQANPSRINIEKNQIIFAHCTVPVEMTENFSLDTHFETDLSVGIKGKIKEGRGTIFKTSGDFKEYFVTECEIESNLNEKNLCRTQIVLKPETNVGCFLEKSIGNHHLILKGSHKLILEYFFRRISQ